MTQSLFVQLVTGTVHISVKCMKKMLFVLSHNSLHANKMQQYSRDLGGRLARQRIISWEVGIGAYYEILILGRCA